MPEGLQVDAPDVARQVDHGGAGDERGHSPGRHTDGEVPAVRPRHRPRVGLAGGGALRTGREARVDVRSDRDRVVLGPYAQQGDAELPAAIDRAAGVTRIGGFSCLDGLNSLNNDGEGVAGLDSGVTNAARPNGTTFLDVVWGDGGFADRGAFLQKVQRTVEQFTADGLLSRRDGQKVLVTAGKARLA